MQGRGLKQHALGPRRFGSMSPLMQGRGLKLALCSAATLVTGVAPHAGAWIETGLTAM